MQKTCNEIKNNLIKIIQKIIKKIEKNKIINNLY